MKAWPTKSLVLNNHDSQTLFEKCLPAFNQIIQQQAIDNDLVSQLKDIYLPLAAWMADKHSTTPLVFAINGAQGSGKSTLSTILKMLLTEGFSKSVAVVSIDDFYLPRQARNELAEQVHPLFKVRGVPGTHDVALIEKVFADLLEQKWPIKIPAFDKAQDERQPEAQWRIIDKPVDIILFEGWCVGAQAQQQDELHDVVNELEGEEDAQGSWRQYVNSQLQGAYHALFKKIDYLLMLKVPDMESVLEWRCLQETKLAQHCEKHGLSSAKVMSLEEIRRFIMHYERLTNSMLSEMPQRADILLELNPQHQIEAIRVVE